MRQAGRHMKEFREFRKQHSFFEICQNPHLACQATLMPIKRYDLDAAIIFSDILVIPQALGLNVEMKEGEGPIITNPVTIETVHLLEECVPKAVQKLGYVGQAVTLARHKLEGKVPLFGFSGGPWTLMGYMIEGKGSKTYSNAKKWLYKNETSAHSLLQLLSDVIIDYLVMQIESGAQIVQVFESNADYLNEKLFDTFCKPYLKSISEKVRLKLKSNNIENVPMVLFAKGGHYSLKMQKDLGYDMIGVDWTISPKIARETLGYEIPIQGNLDPCALYGPETEIRKQVKEMIEDFGVKNYVANLGHGIYPDMEESAVEIFIDAVHQTKINT